MTAPVVVDRFEFQLLKILRFLIGSAPLEPTQPLLNQKLPAPACLGKECLRLVEDTLAKGLVLYLTRAGGWRRETTLRAGEPVSGRVWERIPLEERRLTFGPSIIEFLILMTAQPWGEVGEGPCGPLEPGDELFFTMAWDNLSVLNPAALSGREWFRKNPICRLMAPGDFAGDREIPDFTVCFSGVRAAILESLQPVLVRKLIRSERAKGRIGDWDQLRAIGEAEELVWSRFLAAAEKAGRPDLARFFLMAAARLLEGAEDPPLSMWLGGLQGTGPQRLSERLETQRAALALLRRLVTLQQWERKARSVGYFDDDYRAAQLWKSDWESFGGELLRARAKRITDRLEPLRGE